MLIMLLVVLQNLFIKLPQLACLSRFIDRVACFSPKLPNWQPCSGYITTTIDNNTLMLTLMLTLASSDIDLFKLYKGN